jgi:hypothetical protein
MHGNWSSKRTTKRKRDRRHLIRKNEITACRQDILLADVGQELERLYALEASVPEEEHPAVLHAIDQLNGIYENYLRRNRVSW